MAVPSGRTAALGVSLSPKPTMLSPKRAMKQGLLTLRYCFPAFAFRLHSVPDQQVVTDVVVRDRATDYWLRTRRCGDCKPSWTGWSLYGGNDLGDSILTGLRVVYLNIYGIDKSRQWSVQLASALCPEAKHEADNGSGGDGDEPCGDSKSP